MIGAAAARHLAETGTTVALIGPGEPTDRRTASGPFASHHDRARVTRVAADDHLWARMAAAAIARYDDIATRSGMDFHTPCGLTLVVNDPDIWLRTSLENGGEARLVDADWLAERTDIVIEPDLATVYEPAPAGVIDPMTLVAAQSVLVDAAGGLVIDAAVESLSRSGRRWRLVGRFGEVTADRVLLATGGFGSDLHGRAVELIRRPRTVVMAEIPRPVGDRLPALLYDAPISPDLGGIYWTPPVEFPDGRRYLKIGGDMHPEPEATEAELVDWFRGDGDRDEVAALAEAIGRLLPGVEVTKLWSKPCVVVYTPTGYPYVGWVDDGLAVVRGGNGAAAKSSDEVGRLASTLFGPSGWDRSYDPDAFAPRFI
jgi:sarcosine oxidase